MRRPVFVAFLVPLLLTLTAVGVRADQPKPTPKRTVGLKFENPKETEFLKAVLTSLGLAYTVTVTPTGELVEWASTDALQELEIQNRVSQYWFITTQCKGIQPPSPSRPALKSLSCEG
jgi:hypothetical protein